MKKLWIILISLLVAATIGTFWYLHRPSLIKFSDSVTQASLNYSKSLLAQPLSDQDKTDKFVLRLTNHPDQPELLATLRYEDGLRAPANILKKDTRELLLENLDKAYPQRFKDYKKLSETKFSRSGHDGAEIYFTYTGPTGTTIKQRFMLLIKDDDTAIYLSAQAREADFPSLNHKYFNSMFESLGFR